MCTGAQTIKISGVSIIGGIGKKEHRNVVCNNECMIALGANRIPPQVFRALSIGGTEDFGWVKVSMVRADASSVLDATQGPMLPGGKACGYIINIPNHNYTIYYSGFTNVFGDMKLIDTKYKPDVAIIPIAGSCSMGPREAAYSVKNYLTTP